MKRDNILFNILCFLLQSVCNLFSISHSFFVDLTHIMSLYSPHPFLPAFTGMDFSKPLLPHSQKAELIAPFETFYSPTGEDYLILSTIIVYTAL